MCCPWNPRNIHHFAGGSGQEDQERKRHMNLRSPGHWEDVLQGKPGRPVSQRCPALFAMATLTEKGQFYRGLLAGSARGAHTCLF